MENGTALAVSRITSQKYALRNGCDRTACAFLLWVGWMLPNEQLVSAAMAIS